MGLDWKQLVLGKQDWMFLTHVALRSFVMFLVIVIGLRVLGRRGVKQLSVFELGVVVGLGSAAGDPMFYEDVGLLACVVVFVVVLALYRVLELATTKFDRLAVVVEGNAREIITLGRLDFKAFEAEPMSRDELFTQLRLEHVSHLGQVKRAILEPTGEISIFCFPAGHEVAGLPVLPGAPGVTCPAEDGEYACARCGWIEALAAGTQRACPHCEGTTWMAASTEPRVT